MNTKAKTAGMIIFTDTHHKGKTELAALLHRRGRWNFEVEKPELYPYGCEVSAHGKVLDEDNKDCFHAAMREVERELGPVFAKILSTHKDDIIVLCDSPTKITYGIKVTADVLKYIKLEASSGGMELISQNELVDIHDLKDFSKISGVNDLRVIAMFSDEIEALRTGFMRFSARK